MSAVRLLPFAATAAAFAVAGALLLTIDGDALAMIEHQQRIGHTPYAVGIGWMILAPVVLILAAGYLTVSRLPWVVVGLAHLVALAAVSEEFAEMMSTGFWLAALASALGVVGSFAALAAGGRARPGAF
ncbi:hypothetical protein [Nocardioides sp.]|uniref:hypothetical protein n=1 Tax=Nocardioides sp. TaxID=35761 RepID=UPI002B278639|nr:hypothetical protein [Nocardioides sp.]